MVDNEIVYDQALVHFALIGDGAYEEVILTSSQILLKWNLDRLILVLGTCFVHINIKNPSLL